MKLYSYSFEFHHGGSAHGIASEATLAGLFTDYAYLREVKEDKPLTPCLAEAIRNGAAAPIIREFAAWLDYRWAGDPVGDRALADKDDVFQWQEQPAVSAALSKALNFATIVSDGLLDGSIGQKRSQLIIEAAQTINALTAL